MDKIRFPSPCGEKVGINRRGRWVGSAAPAFPSPCGEKVGINGSRLGELWRTYVVSVPLRGKGRDQLEQEYDEAVGRLVVSVPLRGKGRDQP